MPVCTKGSQHRKASMKFKLVLSGLENSEIFSLPRRAQATHKSCCLLLKQRVQDTHSPLHHTHRFNLGPIQVYIPKLGFAVFHHDTFASFPEGKEYLILIHEDFSIGSALVCANIS